MLITSKVRGQVRSWLCSIALVPVLLLPACADKEPAADPAHQAELTQVREVAQREKSARQLAEARLGDVLWLVVLGSGVALALGLAIGRSSRKHSSSTLPDSSLSAVQLMDPLGWMETPRPDPVLPQPLHPRSTPRVLFFVQTKDITHATTPTSIEEEAHRLLRH